jgi:circadian clock protein KaiC
VYPRLVAAESRRRIEGERLPSGLAGLDDLMQGGLDRGTSTLLLGPAGSGKSTIAFHYALAAAQDNERSVAFLFDESTETVRLRAEGLGMPLGPAIADGRLTMRQVDPAELSPGEFSHLVREAVLAPQPARVVVIDSLNGYMHAMPDEKFLTLHLHELLMFLGQHNVVTILVVAQQGLIGPLQNVVDASYLADSVILFMYVEMGGRVKQALSVIKKRSGMHERSIRSFDMGPEGVKVGPIIEPADVVHLDAMAQNPARAR